MTCAQIVERAAYEIGDEGFDFLTKDEYLRYLERVLRELCRKTRVMRKSITITLPASRSVYIYSVGPPILADDILGVYYVSYLPLGATDALPCTEGTKDSVIAAYRETAVTDYADVAYRSYYVERIGTKVAFVFSHIPTAGDTVTVEYYVRPQIGSLTLTTEPQIGATYHDDLVLGLTVPVVKRLYVLALGGRSGLNKDSAKAYSELYKENKELWKDRMSDIEKEIKGFLDSRIPLQMQVATPFEDLGDDVDTEEDLP